MTTQGAPSRYHRPESAGSSDHHNAQRDIASIVDIECDGLRERGVTDAIKIDENAAQLKNFAQSRRILPTRHGGLRGQVVPRRASARKRA